MQFYNAAAKAGYEEPKSLTNIAAEIDIDALKILKLRINELENRQKIKTASLNSRFTGSKKEKWTSTIVHFFLILKPKVSSCKKKVSPCSWKDFHTTNKTNQPNTSFGKKANYLAYD